MNAHTVVDVHQHVGPWPLLGHWGGIEENVRLMLARQVDVAIISSTLAIVQDMALGNALLAQDLQRYPNLYGYITLNPTVLAQSQREIERYGANARFVGYKIHTNYSGCGMGDPRMAALLAVLHEHPRPLLIHTWGLAEVAALRALAQRFPHLPIIMAHAGGEAWRAAIGAARDCPNLYLDFCASTPAHGAVAQALSEVGAARIVFGTDCTLFDPLYMRAVYEAAPMSMEERALIMGGNALGLFPLGV